MSVQPPLVLIVKMCRSCFLKITNQSQICYLETQLPLPHLHHHPEGSWTCLENQLCGHSLRGVLPILGYVVGGAAAPQRVTLAPTMWAGPGGGGSLCLCLSENKFGVNLLHSDELCQLPLLSFLTFPLLQGFCFLLCSSAGPWAFQIFCFCFTCGQVNACWPRHPQACTVTLAGTFPGP